MNTSPSDCDLRIILGYLSDPISQILPKGLDYIPLSVTHRRQAEMSDLPAGALREMEERARSAKALTGFYSSGAEFLARHPEYVDGIIRTMKARGISDPDGGRQKPALTLVVSTTSL